MKEKIRYVVRRGTKYLVAIAYTDSKTPRWSDSAYDAVRIADRADAEELARMFGADICLFSNLKGVME